MIPGSSQDARISVTICAKLPPSSDVSNPLGQLVISWLIMSRTKLVALLCLSVLFVVLGLWIAISGDVRLGLGCVFFFGGGLAVFSIQLADANREQTSAQLDGTVRLPASVPLRDDPKRFIMGLSLILLAGMGSILVGSDRQPMLVPLGLLLLGVGVVVGILRSLGYLSSMIMFAPDGIHLIQKRQRYVIPFEQIVRAESAEWNGHLLVMIWPQSFDAVAATVAPSSRRETLLRAMKKSQEWMGAPLVIWPQRFALEGGLLLRALERYIREPSTRAELAPQGSLNP